MRSGWFQRRRFFYWRWSVVSYLQRLSGRGLVPFAWSVDEELPTHELIAASVGRESSKSRPDLIGRHLGSDWTANSIRQPRHAGSKFPSGQEAAATGAGIHGRAAQWRESHRKKFAAALQFNSPRRRIITSWQSFGSSMSAEIGPNPPVPHPPPPGYVEKTDRA